MATEPQTMFFPMNVVKRKTRQVEEERRKIKRRVVAIHEEMQKISERNWNIKELLEKLQCIYTQYAKNTRAELHTEKQKNNAAYSKLIDESHRLENMPEPEVEISLADLTREEFGRVHFTDWGWELRLDDGNILQVAPKQKAFMVLNPRNRCAQSSRY